MCRKYFIEVPGLTELSQGHRNASRSNTWIAPSMHGLTHTTAEVENLHLQFQQSLHRLRSATSEETGFLQMSCTAQKQRGNNSHCLRSLLSLPGDPVLSGSECKLPFPHGYTHTHTQAERFHQVLLNLDFSRDGNAGKIHHVFQCAVCSVMVLLDLHDGSTDCPLQWRPVGLGTAAEARQPRG